MCFTILPVVVIHRNHLFVKFRLLLAALPLLAVSGLRAQSLPFVLINDEAGIDHIYGANNFMGGGVAFFDYDNDGWEDIYMAGGNRQDALYHNNGDGTFTERGSAAGLTITNGFGTHAVTTGDYNRDGYRDVFLGTLNFWSNKLLRNNGDGTFTDVTTEAGLADHIAWSAAVAFGDYNLDGWPDLYVGNYTYNLAITYDSVGVINGFAHDCDENWLFLNNGNGTFSDVTGLLNAGADTGCVLALAWTDVDFDHDPDLFVINDFGEFIVPNQLLRNNAPAAFQDVSSLSNADVGMYGMGIAVGDYDHDGDLDYYATNIGLNHLYANNGNGTFTDKTFDAGVEDIWVRPGFYTVGWGTVFADLDNDTWHELVLSNGHMPAAEFIRNDIDNPNRLFYNNGDGTFTDIAPASGIDHPGVCRGLAYSDYDQDGDLDLLFANIQSYYSAEVDKVLLYRNEHDNPDAHWLGVKLVGITVNPDAFGAKVLIELDGASWVDEVSGGCSHASQNSSILHFGLGSETDVNRLTVYWPGGQEQVLENVAADQILTIVQDTAGLPPVSGLPGLDLGLGLRVRPNPVVQDTRISLELPAAASASRVSVLDPAGRSVALLHSGSLPSGTTTLYWNGADATGQRLSPGTYLVEVLLDSGLRRVERVVVVR